MPQAGCLLELVRFGGFYVSVLGIWQLMLVCQTCVASCWKNSVKPAWVKSSQEDVSGSYYISNCVCKVLLEISNE